MAKCSLERGKGSFSLNIGARHIGEKFPSLLLANRVIDKSRPPAAAIFHSAKAIAPFGSSRRRTRFFFQGRQMRGCRLRRDVQRKFLRDRRFFAPFLVNLS